MLAASFTTDLDPSMAGPSSSNGKEIYLDDDYVPSSLADSTSTSSSSSSKLRSYVDSSASSLYSFLAPALGPLNNAALRFDKWREHLDLPYPGQVDTLGREAKSEQLVANSLHGELIVIGSHRRPP